MSVNQTENKRKGIHQIGYCLKYLMTFLSPYKGGLILGLLMVLVNRTRNSPISPGSYLH